MQRERRILILKVILKSMLLFAALWLLWMMFSAVPGGPGPQAGTPASFTAPLFVAILLPTSLPG
jgi:hypothetical protein